MSINILNVKLGFICLIFSYPIVVVAGSEGEQLYMQNCMICHADDGSGAMPGVNNLMEKKAWSTIDNETLLSKLKQGVQDPGSGISMPAKGGNQNLTDSDLKKIVRYMRQTFLK